MNQSDVHAVVQCLVPLIRNEAEKLIEGERKRQSRKKREWVKPWIAKRPKLGASASLLKELVEEDPTSYRNLLRLDSEKFEWLLELVSPIIQKKHTHMRDPIPARLKLEATLRYLATGDSFASLKYLFRLPTSTTSIFLPEVLSAISNALQDYMKIPRTEKEWKKIQDVFHQRWNFPDCCGALDGKHIQIKRPKGTGSEFRNYKGTSSIVLFAMVDGDYCFQYIDIGSSGSAGDGAIFKQSSLNIAMERNALNMPRNAVVIGDAAFPLRPNLLKPFSRKKMTPTQRIFNYRLSRARRVVENAFGILAARFRIFSKPIDLKILDTVDLVVQTCCILHNWLRITSPKSYLSAGSVDLENIDSGEIIPGSWRTQISTPLPSVSQLRGDRDRKAAERRRIALSNYFVGDGAVPWQWNSVGINSVDSCITITEGEEDDSDPDDPDSDYNDETRDKSSSDEEAE